ncbi:TRAP transporter large permease [Halalkalibacter krulwichiae]|uniref:Sialic acid TRAP transporter permease protein SiaT n=1 Tax=Halalkalibacter krulwichiae TaxID=199441 RepID=A0A1X9M8R7_9BACI|nr:TRAP transporter large permease subunit [Halalkalibacter krulwichiae]ARK29777.1 Sialic acid TRAP transporter permease protein SiaT [Halalkalibacter krulwichiae]
MNTEESITTEEIDITYNQNKGKPSRFKKVIQLIDHHFEEVFIVLGFLTFILFINAQVLNRYLLPFLEIGNITTWTEEVSRYIFIWISYLGASLAIKRRESIQVNFFIGRLSEDLRKSINIANSIFIIYFSYILIENGYATLLMQWANNQTSPALGIPMVIPYAAVPLGFALIMIRVVQNIVIDLKGARIKDIAMSIGIASILGFPLLWLSSANVALILFGYFALFIIIGMPIAFALGISTLAAVLATNVIPMNFFSQTAFTSIDNFPVMAIPFFVVAGLIMGGGSLIKRLLKLSDHLLGFLPGGLALVAIVTSMFFSAISGSGPATVAAIGTLLIPAMIKQGYHPGFATAVIAAAGSIGVIIPPSNPFVIYGVMSQQSISQLFIAGILPGVLTGLVLLLFAFVISKKNNWQGETTSFSLKGATLAAWDAKLALLVPVLILGGIYGGIMTPTEAAAIAAAYGLIIGMFVYKDLSIKQLYHCLVKAGMTSSVIILLIVMATIFGRLITVERIAETVASFVLSISENKFVILLLLNVFLLLIGLVLEALAAIVILTPILLPIILMIGVDPVHFGIIMVFNLAIGFITPPVGVNLFVAAGVTKTPIETVISRIGPFLLAMIVVLMLITYIPEISLWLVGLMR